MKTGSNPLRAVLDTNVLFSAVGFPSDSPPSKVLDLARTGQFEGVTSAFILEELTRNLRENLAWEEEALIRLRRKLKSVLTIIEPRIHANVIKRKDSDNRILECAVASKAAALITGDLKDLRSLGHFQGIEILTPREFLHKYFPNA